MSLLFQERYGVKVSSPSMAPVIAWLASMDDEVRERVLKRSPELLIRFGDPARLPSAARECLLRWLVNPAANRQRRHLQLELQTLEQLVQADIGHVVELTLEQSVGRAISEG